MMLGLGLNYWHPRRDRRGSCVMRGCGSVKTVKVDFGMEIDDMG
jgi:hypothetical protein